MYILNCFISFQSPRTRWLDSLLKIHDFTFVLMMFMLSLLFFVIIYLMYNKYYYSTSGTSSSLETWWTLIPMNICLFLSVPTLISLFSLSSMDTPLITVKAIGHQWYWEYEMCMSSFMSYVFDSYMNLPEINKSRLLDTSGALFLPSHTNIRILTTSVDVLHAIFIPSLGMKMDAIPGRLAETILNCPFHGVVEGMCAELCGKGHGNMPIRFHFVDLISFKNLMM